MVVKTCSALIEILLGSLYWNRLDSSDIFCGWLTSSFQHTLQHEGPKRAHVHTADVMSLSCLTSEPSGAASAEGSGQGRRPHHGGGRRPESVAAALSVRGFLPLLDSPPFVFSGFVLGRSLHLLSALLFLLGSPPLCEPLPFQVYVLD